MTQSGDRSSPVRVALMGSRHGHINGVIAQAKAREDTLLVAACEEDDEARAALVAAGVVDTPYDDYSRMLDEVDCDVIAVGEYFGKQEAVIIEALRRGKHVISDKPICTDLAELDEIEKLVKEKGLSVGCQLDMRFTGLFRMIRQLVSAGDLGEVHTVSFEGQHPLMYGLRAGWYFEEGKHCGTINDLAIHALDYIPWVTGKRFTTVNAARNWNVGLKNERYFKNACQMMLTMENGCGVLGDSSYIVPDSFEYALPQYHRTVIWGSDGVLEAGWNIQTIKLYRNGATEAQAIAPLPATGLDSFDAFLREMRGETKGLELTTAEVIRSSRVALTTQHAADHGLTNVAI